MGPARGQLLSSRSSGEGCGWARHQAPGGARASTRRSRPQGGLGGKQGVAAEGRRSRHRGRRRGGPRSHEVKEGRIGAVRGSGEGAQLHSRSPLLGSIV